MADAGAAVVIRDDELTAPRLAEVVGEIAGEPQRLERMAGAARALARPDAARDIAREVVAAAERSAG
jgi:UDP-N-acetylglucosamine--N-acetylmuramyl-(pentapeptide) pyrophosphoryl-undecaprenol N-acetylglucosamine transferase